MKMLAQTNVRDIIRQKNSSIRRMKVDFEQPQSPEVMKPLLKNSPHREERLAALDNFPQDDVSILPLLNQATQHWHTGITCKHAIPVCPQYRVYESRVDRFSRDDQRRRGS
jgi:hypothetical protein